MHARLAAVGPVMLVIFIGSVACTSELRAQDPVLHRFDDEARLEEPAAFGSEVMARPSTPVEPLVAFSLLAFAVLAIAYRARIGAVLELERQRTLLAMDLHDEVGSGLASIAILSELAADGAEGDVDKKTLVGEIATTSRDLSSALSDLVWSLDQRPSTLKDLADRLVDHGARLFSNGGTRFNLGLPESWPATPVAFQVRRGVLLIGLEALHNAAAFGRAGRDVVARARGHALAAEDRGRRRQLAGRRVRPSRRFPRARPEEHARTGTSVARRAPEPRDPLVTAAERLRRWTRRVRRLATRVRSSHRYAIVAFPSPSILLGRPARARRLP